MSFDSRAALRYPPPMPTYVYETLGAQQRRFELVQSMKDAALTHDPETGEPVRRVISGGYGVMQKGTAAPSSGGHACGGGGCGCH
jgi:predicted nucleic acid-binding Zn ribbon protein